MKIDYNQQAFNYERTRTIEPIVYSILSCMLTPQKDEAILDFGYGTGNYLKQFSIDYGIEVYGIEPSVKMRKIAQEKLQSDHILAGDHTAIPFSNIRFNKLYSTDVVHHIDHLDLLFQNLFKISNNGAKFCICTESSDQLKEKYWLKYFPSILSIDQKRFHPIEEVIRIGENAGWVHRETVKTETQITASISGTFLERIRQKSLSVLNLISSEEYQYGVSLMETDYQNQVLLHQNEGYTFILFERKS